MKRKTTIHVGVPIPSRLYYSLSLHALATKSNKSRIMMGLLLTYLKKVNKRDSLSTVKQYYQRQWNIQKESTCMDFRFFIKQTRQELLRKGISRTDILNIINRIKE
jgi:hypothetical protein